MSYMILIERWSPGHAHWRASVTNSEGRILQRIEQPFAREERAVEAAQQVVAELEALDRYLCRLYDNVEAAQQVVAEFEAQKAQVSDAATE